MVLTQLYIHMGKNEFQPIPYTIYLKMDLNLKHKTVKIPKEIKRKILVILDKAKCLWYETKSRIHNFDFLTILTF